MDIISYFIFSNSIKENLEKKKNKTKQGPATQNFNSNALSSPMSFYSVWSLTTKFEHWTYSSILSNANIWSPTTAVNDDDQRTNIYKGTQSSCANRIQRKTELRPTTGSFGRTQEHETLPKATPMLGFLLNKVLPSTQFHKLET